MVKGKSKGNESELDNLDDDLTQEEKDLGLTKELSKAYDDLDINSDDVEKDSKIPFSKEDNDILKVQGIAEEYKATLEGKKKDRGNKEFVQDTKAIASQVFINLTYSMLNSFAEQSNIVSNKTIETFMIQYKDAFNKMQNSLLRDRGMENKHQSVIIKLFKDKLFNIGQIITNNKGNMEAIVGRFHTNEEDNKFDF